MSDEFDRVCCGETEHCKECTLFETLSSTSNGENKTFTRNALGRCDFYNGPSKQIVDTKAL